MGLFVKKLSPEGELPSSIHPPVLLLHGFCEDHTIWENMLSAFPGRTIYLVDLPGFGKSNVELPNPLSIDWVAEVIYRQVIDPEQIEPIVVGHSLGGYVALAMAEKYGNSLKGLCLFHSTVFADSPEKKATRNKVIDYVSKSGVESFTTEFVPGLFHSLFRRKNPDIVQQVVDLAGRTRLDTLTAYTAAMRDRPERSEVLKMFGQPKLIIAGEKDGAVPLEQSLLMKEMVGSDQFVLLEETAHMGMYEQTETCKKALSSLA
ncbi:MAG: alpha/beta hydrolase [Imperialibacter sp.]